MENVLRPLQPFLTLGGGGGRSKNPTQIKNATHMNPLQTFLKPILIF